MKHTKKLLEAEKDPFIFTSRDDDEKFKNRARDLKRMADQAEKAARVAEKKAAAQTNEANKQILLNKAEDLRKKAQEIRDFLDGVDVEDEPEEEPKEKPPITDPPPPEDPRQPPEDPRQPPEDPRQPPEDPRQPPEDPRQPPEDPRQPPEDPRQPPEINPFKKNLKRPEPGRPPRIPPKPPSIDTIIKLLKEVEGDGHDGIIQALKDILSEQYGIDADTLDLTSLNSDSSNESNSNNIEEAMMPMPKKKNLLDWTNDELNDYINDIVDEINTIVNLPLDSPETRKDKITRIKDLTTNPNIAKELEIEDKIAAQADYIKAREQENKKYSNYETLDQFSLDLYNTVNRQVQIYKERRSTPTRINRQYETERDLIKYGDRDETSYKQNKPIIDVFFDRSASWSKADSEIGKRAIATIQRFEDRGEIELHLFYFDNIVTNNENHPKLGWGGTAAWPEIIRQIKSSDATNVVLITDSDMGDRGDPIRYGGCKVEGCVWIIWKNGSSHKDIVNNLVGESGTYQYTFYTD